MPTEWRRIDSLRDIVTCCDQIEEFAAGFTRDQFERDRRTYNAVLYSLQTIGEAAIRLDKEEKRLGERGLMERLYPDVRGRTFAAFRTSFGTATTRSTPKSSGRRPRPASNPSEMPLARKSPGCERRRRTKDRPGLQR